MKPATRSASGAVLMLAIIPFVAGLLACMPAPIGDPERSRVDPDISGVWITTDGEDSALYHFRPYDKRTWLVIGTVLKKGPSFEGETLDIDASGIAASEPIVYKAWLTRLGGVQFMTWEMVGGLNRDGSVIPDFWWVFKVVKVDRDNIELHVVDVEHEAFEHIVSPDDYDGDDYPRDMRRTWERALKKSARDETLYEEATKLRRVPDELLGKAAKLFKEVIGFE